jgi:hypothetical protein
MQLDRCLRSPLPLCTYAFSFLFLIFLLILSLFTPVECANVAFPRGPVNVLHKRIVVLPLALGHVRLT